MKVFPVNLSPAWITILITGLATRLGLAVWGLLSFWVGIPVEIMERRQIYYYGLQPITEGAAGVLWGVWQRWDTIHYIRIAQAGYTHNELTAFFPFYPGLGYLLSTISGMDVLAVFCLLSLACALLAMLLLYKIVEEHINPAWAAPTIVMMALFPSSFFFFAPYPQSLGMMLLLLAIWSALRQRWLAAACAGLAAGLTHSTVAPLAVTLGLLAAAQVWPYLRGRFPQAIRPWMERLLSAPVGGLRRRNWLALGAALTPILGTLLFLAWRVWSNFPPFGPYLLERWGRTSQWPWITLLRLPQITQSTYFGAAGWANLAAFGLAIAVTLWSIKRLPGWLWIYQLTGLILLLSQDLVQEVLGGFNRYVLFLFPIFIALAAWTQGRKRLRLYLLVIFALMQLYLSLLHMQWVWVG